MNAYEVLKQHHAVLKGLGRQVSAAPMNSQERHELFDEMLLELDIYFRIEDDPYYPALAAASELVAIAYAEHRQVVDQLRRAVAYPTNFARLRRRVELVQDRARGPCRWGGMRHDSRASAGADHRRRT